MSDVEVCKLLIEANSVRLLSVFLGMLPNNLSNGLCLTNVPFLVSKVDLKGFFVLPILPLLAITHFTRFFPLAYVHISVCGAVL